METGGYVIKNTFNVLGKAMNRKFMKLLVFNLVLNMSNWPFSRGLFKNIHPPLY